MPPPAHRVTVTGISGLPLFEPGDDLVAILGDALAAGESVHNGDVIVVAQKIVSKVEGRAVRLADVIVDDEARALGGKTGKNPALVTLIMAESAALMRLRPNLVIARHRSGHVLANAGIDASNVPCHEGETVLLWPADPDASARSLRLALEARFGVALGVIISDSLGRAWRMGTTGSAIGTSGLKPLQDRRGEADLFGRKLQATIIGVADEIAGAASLVMGEGAEGVPAALVRGAVFSRDENSGVQSMLRTISDDLFP